MEGSVVCHVCENFRGETVDYLNRRGLSETVSLDVFRPCCVHSRPDAPSATTRESAVVESSSTGCGTDAAANVYIVGPGCPYHAALRESGGCASGALLAGGCLGIVAPPAILENLIGEGAYLMNPGWLNRWQERTAEWGFAPTELPVFFHDSADSLCLIDTLVEPDINASLVQIGETLELPVVRIPVGMSYFDTFADSVFSATEQPPNEELPTRRQPVREVTADYAMALDLLVQLSHFQTEAQIVQQLLHLFITLFAPGQAFLVRFLDGAPVGVNHVDHEETIADSDTISMCRSLSELRAVTPHGRGYAIPFDFADERIALLFISEFATDAYRESYRNLIESIAPICSLTLKNARNYEVIVRGLDFRQRLLSIIGHDLRGPLGSMVSLLKIMYDEIENKHPESVTDVFGEIIRAGEKTMLLLNGLLEWGKAQTESMALGTDVIDLHSATRSVFDMLESQAALKAVSLRNAVPSDSRMRVDSNVLETILRNLVSNAIKFSHSGTTVSVTTEHHDGKLIVKVSDTGIGMDANTAESVLKFTRRRSTAGTNGEEGVGLGLVLCRDLLRKIGGELELQSEKGVGTTVSLSFRASEPSSTPPREPALAEATAPIPLSSCSRPGPRRPSR